MGLGRHPIVVIVTDQWRRNLLACLLSVESTESFIAAPRTQHFSLKTLDSDLLFVRRSCPFLVTYGNVRLPGEPKVTTFDFRIVADVRLRKTKQNVYTRRNILSKRVISKTQG